MRPQTAIDNLRDHQEQCDDDGIMVKVSRQALCEVLEYLMLKPVPGELTVECPHCHQRVSETQCTERTSKNCYHFIIRRADD